jgi:flagellar motor switch/type III secretory pathway protein FliN
LSLIWPADSPGDVFIELQVAKTSPAASASKAASPSAAPAAPTSFTPAPIGRGVEELPAYSRSLLRIKVPVIVTLAETKQPIGRIVELGPGTIIQFDKSCEEMLSLQVGDQPVAEGEAVKVGDKFGIRLTSLRLPGERFKPVKRR